MTIGSRRRITREALFSVIPEYAGAPSKDAAERMFERDKAEILSLGLDLHTEVDTWDESVVHYRIGPTAGSLPALEVSRAEYTVLLAASRAWDEAAAGGAARRVRAKLLGLGLDPDPELERRTPRAAVESLPVLAPLLEAVSGGHGVTFRYRSAAGAPSDRRVEPWVVGVHDGHWYVLGHDLDRDAPRLFRASRIESFPRRGGVRTRPVPADADLAEAIGGASHPDAETADAVLELAPYKALSLRDRVGAGVADPEAALRGAHRTAVRRLVLGSSRWATVREPAAWREELAEITERVASLHAAPGDLSLLDAASPRERTAIRTPSSSTDHLSRLISEAAYVLARGEASLTAMAAEFGITQKRLVDDLQILFVCGDLGAGWEDLIDVEWDDGWVRVRNADALGTPLRLSPAEATTLLAGLAALTPARGEERELVTSAREKLTALVRGGAEGPAEVEARPAGADVAETRSDRIVARIQEALVAESPLTLRYSAPDRPGTTRRVVLPLRLETTGGRGYLRADDRTVGAERTFRIDRIVEILDGAAGTLPDDDDTSEATPRARETDDAGHAWVRLEGPASWIADSFAASDVRDLPGGGVLARIDEPVRSALVDAVLEAAGTAELLTPPDLRAEIASVSRGAAVRHGARERIN